MGTTAIYLGPLTGSLNLKFHVHGCLASSQVVEDGSGKANATTYMSVGRVTELIGKTPYFTAWSKVPYRQKTTATEQVTKYLDERYRFYGQTLTSTQALQWPRTKNYDRSGNLLGQGVIPKELLEAFILLCGYWTISKNLTTIADPSGTVKQIEAEGMRIYYDPTPGAASAVLGVRFPDVELMLKQIGEFKPDDWFLTQKTFVRK